MNRLGLWDQNTLSSELLMILNEAAQYIDDATHETESWASIVAVFLESLEFHSMANDAQYPQRYEQMLARLKERIEERLKAGAW
jgi:hypothetical protein